ncbi:Hsp70 family protein [Streptomyces sp. SBT349]|uniref:Hsp70 family protein n=1 Tax=Streptomyces sp. SBT349 TaxID=1580539 RepID=UPI001F45183B|nr:Hsp70 family protein [Streptomyces sp. SBT349]
MFDTSTRRARPIPNRAGSARTPSAVAFTEDGRRLVGRAARERAVLAPAAVAEDIPARLAARWPFEHAGVRHDPVDLAAAVIGSLLDDAERELGERPRAAVLASPSHAGLAGRCAVAEAAERAGLEVSRLIGDTAATALAHASSPPRDIDGTVVVLDLGGGSLGLSLAEIGDGVCEILATGGDGALGGLAWDRRLAEHLCDAFEDTHGVRLREDPVARRRVAEAAERAKIALSTAQETEIRVPSLARAAGGGLVDLEATVSRSELAALTRDLARRCAAALDGVFAGVVPERASAYGPSSVREVLLAGEAARLPALHELLVERYRGRRPRLRTADPHSVAAGAAIQAAGLTGHQRDALLMEVTPAMLAVATDDAGHLTPVIPRGTTIPRRRTVTVDLPGGRTPAAVGVYEGNAPSPARNDLLAVLELPARPGPSRAEVTIDVASNRTVHASARDLATGRITALTVSDRTIGDAIRRRWSGVPRG